MSEPDSPPARGLSDHDAARLLAFRDGLRRFLHWSEQQARQAGLTPAQHQLLLAIRGHSGRPAVGDVVDHLQLRHHSVVELIDRAERADLVRRVGDDADHRVVRLELTDEGARRLADLSAAHLEELSRLRPSFETLWDHLPEDVA
ncbi:MAG: winged helix-turn-helix transcriptional regulator [Acidimicrobiales bacterium]|nr:winged helix-turn-helix transcriptional regulator [Acidimicrobiales bacterium]